MLPLKLKRRLGGKHPVHVLNPGDSLIEKEEEEAISIRSI